MACLKVLMNHSDNLFEEEWYVADQICLPPFLMKKVANSVDMKYDPLSDIICSARPYAAKIRNNIKIVLNEVLSLILYNSGHYM